MIIFARERNRQDTEQCFGANGIVSANAAARSLSPSGSTMRIAASGKSFSPLCTIASNTGCVSVGVVRITRRISAVAVCSRAQSRSRMNRAIFVSLVFSPLRRFNVLGRCAFAVLPPALSRRLIAPPRLRTGIVAQLKPGRLERGRYRANVRFGSLADICSAKAMSAITPKADMCSAADDVRFVPIADIWETIRSPRRQAQAARAAPLDRASSQS